MLEVKQFETLYGKDKLGKLKQWDIQVERYNDYSVVYIKYGYVDGKKTEFRVKMETGKNIGKKNETTHFEQAILDAQSKWTKKKDIEGYMESNMEKQVKLKLPMLAQDFKKQEKSVRYPVFVQPKLDGYRMIYDTDEKKCYTRTGKEYGSGLYKTRLFEELKLLSESKIVLDGELYIHDRDFNFEQYGVLRKQKITSLEDKKRIEKIEYHVYDIIDETKMFKERYEILEKKLEHPFLKIKRVMTYECKDKRELDEYHERFLREGYEGTMIRNKNGKYICKYRSADLLKYKDFDDNEFKIVDYTYEADTTGKDKNLIVWICETEKGSRFKVQSKGTREERKELYENAKQYIGKYLWVQHCGTTIDGIPRFPKTYRNGKESIREIV
jgi:DNA ligase-1